MTTFEKQLTFLHQVNTVKNYCIRVARHFPNPKTLSLKDVCKIEHDLACLLCDLYDTKNSF